MPYYKVLHFCLPNDDNLGDQLAHSELAECFSRYAITLDIYQIDIRELRNTSTYLDDEIDSFREVYDFIVIGAGGLLLPFFIESIFFDPSTWSRLNMPLVFFGVGAIGEYAQQSWYTNFAADDDSPLVQALRAASTISVRDLRSWLLVSRLINNNQKNLFITGCPTVFSTSGEGDHLPRTHLLALNIPFTHGGCFQFQEQLLQVAHLVVTNIKKIKWICHSDAEYKQALKVRENMRISFDVVLPKTPEDISREYSSCETALVTKAHAGIFCLANNTPFGFLSYDMKCDALMEMIVDFPHHYLCHVDELSGINIPQTLQRIMARVSQDRMKIKKSQRLLVDKFRHEFDSFVNHILGTLEN